MKNGSRGFLFYLIMSLFLVSAVPLRLHADSHDIRVGVYDNRPLIFMTESGPQGLFIDVLKAVAKEEGWSLIYEYGEWEETYRRLTEGELDLLPVVAYSATRETQIDFSRETLITNWGQVCTHEDFDPSSILDLEGKVIATLPNDTHGEHFSTLLDQLGISFEKRIVDSYSQMSELLDEGSVDAGVFNYLISRTHITNNHIQLTPIVFNPIQIRYAVPKGDPRKIADTLDTHIGTYKAQDDSIYWRSLELWIGGTRDGTPIFPRWLLLLLGVTGGISAILALGVVLLRHQVKRQTRQLSEELKHRIRAEEELRKSESLFRKMVANIADVIVIIDENEINRYKSANIEKLFGWKPEEVIGNSTWDNVHPDDREEAKKFLRGLGGVSFAAGTTECRYRCRDGRYRWIEITIVNMLEDEEIQGFLGNYTDITERKRAEEEKERIQSQLLQARKMESVGRLAGGVAHDFNNMLGVIIGHGEMVLQSLEASSPWRENLQEILNAARRSSELTRQLLGFARKQTVSPQILDLNRAISGMLKMLRRLIGENIQLTWHPAHNPCLVKMDSSQIDQILTNLCVNAVDAIDGIGTISISLENVDVNDPLMSGYPELLSKEYVLISVRDDGTGMDQSTLENLFEPFFTTKASGRGTGLGLSTIYGIVIQNGGFIDVESRPGNGAHFKIFIPRYDGEYEPGDTDQDKEAGTEPVRGRETILIVEDEPVMLEMTQAIVESLGYSVITAPLPSEALNFMENQSERIDLLLSDVIMPEMNGRELADRLLKMKPELKLLFMSGYTADIISEQGVLGDHINFIQKPFSISSLSVKIRDILDSEDARSRSS